jgi:hypothetical protein
VINLQQLQIVDDELASYLKISPDERKRFTYYIFEDRLEEHWNVFGLHYLSRAPLLVEIRLMYIDQDARDWSPFVAERDAPGYAFFNRGTYPSVIAFFEETALNKEILDHNESIRHFFLMNRKELLQFHYPQERVEAAVGNYYRYVPEKGVQGSEKISVICLPNWSSPHGENQISSLWFITLSPQQLANPQFDLVDDIDGLGTITFNQRALEELIILLRQRI